MASNRLDIELKTTDRITVAGLPGTGKTTFTRYLSALFMPNVLIYDPLDQYLGFPDANRYIPETDSMEEFEGVCTRLMATSDTMFVIEEAEQYIREGQKLPPNAFKLINRGRNWGVGIVAVTRRIQRLNKDFFDLSQHAFLFRTGLRSGSYFKDMLTDEQVNMVLNLPEYYFVYVDVGRRRAEVGTLDLREPTTKKIETPEPKGTLVKAESGLVRPPGPRG